MENKTVANTGLVAFLMHEEYKINYLSDPRDWVWYNVATNKLVVVGSLTNYLLVKRNINGLVQVGEL